MRSLPYEPWLTLVLVDGKSSAGDLVALKPALPDVPRSLERLLREGYIEVVSPQSIANLAAPTKEPESPAASRARDDASTAFDFFGRLRRWSHRSLVLLPFLILMAAGFLANQSLERLASRVEETLAKKIPTVSIGTSSIIFTPRPALKLTNITVGGSPKAGEVVAQPGWSVLLGRPGPIARLELREATLTGADLLALLQGVGASLATHEFRPRRVMLEASRLDLDGIVLAPLAGELRYSPEGRLDRATLSIDDGKVQLTLVAKGDIAAVELAARNWSTPTIPAVSFERLDATGNLEASRLVLARVEGLLHDGLVTGALTLDWSVGLLAEGRFSAVNLELQRLIGAFTRDFSVGGRLDAEGNFTARADTPAGLIENLGVSADFRVKRGVLYNADITAAAVGDSHGGSTQFEQLTGNVQTAGGSLSFRRIQLGSGLVTAKGTLDITPSRQITGRFTVRFKSQGESANTISVGGSLKEPRLQLGG